MNYKDFITSKNFNPGFYIIKTFALYLTKMFEANPDLGYLPEELIDPVTIYDDNLSQKDALTSLMITTKFDFEEKFREKTPCIIVSRQNITFGSFGTNGMGRMSNVSYDLHTTRYKDIISTPIVIECISSTDLEAEALSSMCQVFIHADDRILRKTGILVQVPPSQTPVQFFDKTQNTFISSLVLQVAMEISYGVKQVSEEVLSEIDIASSTSNNMNIK